MPIASLQPQPRVQPPDIPLEKLAASKSLTDQQKTAEMTRQFEAVLLRQILTDAHKPSFPNKLLPANVSSSIYQDMMVNQLADSISSSRTIGLSQQLEKQFTRQSDAAKSPAPAAPGARAPQAAPPVIATKSTRF